MVQISCSTYMYMYISGRSVSLLGNDMSSFVDINSLVTFKQLFFPRNGIILCVIVDGYLLSIQ